MQSESQRLLTLERDARPNLYASRALTAVPGVLFVCALLVQLNVYEAVDKSVMWGCFGIAALLTGVPLLAGFSPRHRRKPVMKYLLLAVSLLLTLLLCTLLNIHTILVLTLPMILASIYYQPRLVRISWLGSCLVCALTGPLSYLLGTNSTLYLMGYMDVMCRVTSSVVPREVIRTLPEICSILLFYTLPQLLSLFAFGFLFLSIARHGEKSLQLQLQVLSDHTVDALTGLYTHRYFLDQANRLIHETPKVGGLIVVTDIDRFRLYNDRFGRQAGNELLKAAADALRRYVGDNGICGRLSDDHMVMFIKKDVFDKKSFTERVLALPPEPGKGSFSTFMIAGTCETSIDTDIATTCDHAFAACSAGKGYYGIGVVAYSSEMHTSEIKRQQMADELLLALQRDELEPYLQPQCAPDGRLLGAEALVRWIRPDGTVVQPAAFIPLCEQTGIIADVDKLVWRKVCALLREWHDAGLSLPCISVNLSPAGLYRMDVCDELNRLVAHYGLKPADLHLEITETAIARDADRVKPLIGQLRAFGFHVEMDDFGSGTSSLSMLQNLYVDAIKLDCVFLQSLMDADRGQRVLRNVINLADSLDIPLIAEGTETLEQVELLASLGVKTMQGFYFSRPLPAEAFRKQYLEK